MEVKIGSIIKTSLIDFPGKISTTIFFQGCNFRCGYCYNVDVVLPDRFSKPISTADFFSFLETRKGLVDGVTLLGGEPLLQPDIIEFVKKVKEKGFLVKLDTQGSRFEKLKELVDKGLIDYIAMDVKAPLDFESYYLVCKLSEKDFDDVKKSIDFIKKSKVPYEFRTTLAPKLITFDMVREIAEQLKGAKKYILQGFFSRAPSYIDIRFNDIRPYYKNEMELLRKEIEDKGFFEEILLRD